MKRREELDNPANWGLLGLGIGAGVGAALAYLMDPRSGRRRRANVRDQMVHASHASRDLVRRGSEDLRNRLVGSVAEARSHLHREPADDPIVEERVRAILGRYVSHPGSVNVAVHHGVVTLSGPILRREANGAVRAVRHVPGVHEVHDELERHRSADRISALQGQGWVPRRPQLAREHWPPAYRLLGGTTGAVLAAQGLRYGGPFGVATTGAGATLFARAAFNLPLRRLIGLRAGRKAVVVQKDIHIALPPDEVFAFCRRIERFPLFMPHVRSVRFLDGDRVRWEVQGPLGIPLRWDADVTRIDTEHRLLSWKSTPLSTVDQAGTMRVDPEDGGCRLEVRMAYNPPAGALGHALATLLGVDPKHRFDEDLLRLKSLLETGKATAHGKTVTREQVEHEGAGAREGRNRSPAAG